MISNFLFQCCYATEITQRIVRTEWMVAEEQATICAISSVELEIDFIDKSKLFIEILLKWCILNESTTIFLCCNFSKHTMQEKYHKSNMKHSKKNIWEK